MTIILLLLLIMFGVIIGMSIMFFIYNSLLVYKNQVIEDYKKGIDIHNKRELRLIYINQSTKDYVKEQQKILRNKTSDDLTKENYLMAGKYWGFKDTEAAIHLFEKKADELVKD